MYAILHEGKSIDKGFFELLLDKLNLDKNEISFLGMGSKSNFFKINNPRYKDLMLDIQIEKITKILFIMDADYEGNKNYDGYNNTLEQIEKVQKDLNIMEISDTFIAYDMKSEKKEGYLESLILSTLSEEQDDCIHSFLEKCPEFRGKNSHKSIFNVIYKNAYPKAPYNFEHQNFDELKQKLIDLFKGIK